MYIHLFGLHLNLINLLLSIDSGSSAILILLDLSAAFDTIDQDILLNRLKCVVGVQGTALQWFTSYLKGRTFSAKYWVVHLTFCAPYGVPQGSILGPLLFSLYMLHLGFIFQKYNIKYHCYADDLQLYLPIKLENDSSFQHLFLYFEEVRTWMANNFLQLNANKTEVLLLGPAALNSTVTSKLGSLSNNLQHYVKNLEVYLD